MNTNISANLTKKRHRHVVVAPLFALAVLWSANVLSAPDIAGSLLSMPDGTMVIDGGIAKMSATNVLSEAEGILHMGNGEALISVEEPVTIVWRGFTVTGWAGTFHLLAKEDLLVSALTTPVLVRQGTAKTLVPVGMQWRSANLPTIATSERSTWIAARSLTPIARKFLEAQLKAAADLTVPVPEDDAPHTFAMIDGLLQLPAAKERAEAQRTAEALDPLEAAIRAGDAVRARELLTAAGITADTTDPILLSRVPLLLGLGALNDVPLETTLTPLLRHASDLQLLASVHPKLEAAYWLLHDGMEMTQDERFLMLWMLPIADHGPAAFAPTTSAAWGTMVREYLYALRDPSGDAQMFLSVGSAIVQNHRENDRPERAEHYAAALHAAILPFETLLSDEDLDVLAALKPSDAYLLDANVVASAPASSAVASSVQSSQASSAIVIHPDQAATEARSVLTAAGVMFTKDTTLRPKNTAVAVSNAVLATPKGDAYFHFTYDVVSGEVSAIADAETNYPYALPLAGFMEWVKTGK